MQKKWVQVGKKAMKRRKLYSFTPSGGVSCIVYPALKIE